LRNRENKLSLSEQKIKPPFPLLKLEPFGTSLSVRKVVLFSAAPQKEESLRLQCKPRPNWNKTPFETKQPLYLDIAKGAGKTEAKIELFFNFYNYTNKKDLRPLFSF
jgi:hypothetical protein